RHVDARTVVPLNQIKNYLLKPVTVIGKVQSSRLVKGMRRSRAEIVLTDNSRGILNLVFFAYPDWWIKRMKIGEEYVVIGYPAEFRGYVQIVQPPFLERLDKNELREGSILPMYSLPKKLQEARLPLKTFREMI